MKKEDKVYLVGKKIVQQHRSRMKKENEMISQMRPIQKLINSSKRMKYINLKAIEVYPVIKAQLEILDKLIKKPKTMDELKQMRKESAMYLANVKIERDIALEFLKKKKLKDSQN